MSTSIENDLRTALREAIKAQDRSAATVLRSALSALANAEAVPADTMPPAGAAETAAVGVGAADAPRRELTEEEKRSIVQDEIADLFKAADECAGLRHPARVEEAGPEHWPCAGCSDPTGSVRPSSAGAVGVPCRRLSGRSRWVSPSSARRVLAVATVDPAGPLPRLPRRRVAGAVCQAPAVCPAAGGRREGLPVHRRAVRRARRHAPSRGGR